MEYHAIEFASYADDTTPYTYGQSLDEDRYERQICLTFVNGFTIMVLKPIQFLLSSFVYRPIKIMGSTLEASKEEVLLGVRIDSYLTFKEHVTNICS